MNTCRTCRFRDKYGYCNNEHLAERSANKDLDQSKCLIYSYDEDGGFWVGENFGCIHYEKRPETKEAK